MAMFRCQHHALQKEKAYSMLNARAVFALLMVLIALPVVSAWVIYRLYKIERLKTRDQRLQDLGRFGVLVVAWFVFTFALEAALRTISGADLVSAGGLPGIVLLAALSLLWFEPRTRTKAIAVICALLAAVIVHAALNLVN